MRHSVDQRLFHSKVVVRTRTHTHTTNRLLYRATKLVASDSYCVFERRPTPDILWFAHDPDFLIEPSVHYRLAVNNHSLTISDVRPADGRHYSCQATNTEGATEPVHQQLHVAGQPIVMC